MSPRHGLAGVVLLLTACGGNPQKPTVEVDETPTNAPAPTTPASTPESAPPAAPTSAAPTPEPAPTSTNGAVSEQGKSLLEQARQAAADEDLGTAKARLEAAVADSPGLAPAHYDLGVLSEWMGRVSTAKTHYEDALRADPEYTAAVVAIARLSARRGDIPGAVAFARQQLGRKPDSLSLRNAYDRVRLLQQGQAADVIATAKKVLRKDEKNVDAMANLAQAYHQQGKHELAIAILTNALAIRADDPEMLMLQALAHEKLDEGPRARLVLEKAIALPGGASAEAYNNLGLVYHGAGDYQGAEAQFRKALARWPDMLAANVNLGNALKGQKRFVDAEASFKRAMAISPKSADVYYNLGILYLDGELPEMTPVQRLERALAFFDRYKQTAGTLKAGDPVKQYIDEARKRIEVEKKRAEQMRRAAKQPPAAPPSEAAPSDPGAPAEPAADPAGEGE